MMATAATQQNTHIVLGTDETQDWTCANCGEPIQIPLDANGIEDAYYCEECTASMTGEGNVSSTEADKAKVKAKGKPTITFSVNVDANYERLVTLAAHMIDEETGSPMSVHAYCKATLFSQLGLNMQGEVLRRKTGQETDEVLSQTLLAQTVGLDIVKNMSKSDRQKMEKVLLNSIKPTAEQLAAAKAAVQGGLAAAVAREAAAKLAGAK